jgi:hypothetical protein
MEIVMSIEDVDIKMANEWRRPALDAVLECIHQVEEAMAVATCHSNPCAIQAK